MRKNTKVLIYNNPLEKFTSTVIYCKPGFCINDLNINKDNYVFYVNGKPSAFDYKLKAEDVLSIYILPKDTENTYIRQGIKLAAVLAVASLTQNWVGGWKMAALLSTNLIANYLLPDLPLDETTPAELLSGTLTEPKEGLRIPKIFGNVHFTPPMAARPHLNPGSGNDASIVYCVALGYGPLDLIGTSSSLQLSGTRNTPHTITDIPDGSITLGGTDIKQAKGVEIEIGDPNTFSIYDELVYDQVVNFSYTRTTGVENNWTPDNVEHIQTMGVAGKNITINIHFPSGYYTKGNDNKVNKSWQDAIEFRVLYKKPTDASWAAFVLPDKYTNFNTKNTDNTYGWFRGGKTKPFWIKLNFTLPTEDIYEIKVVRVRTWTADSEVVRASFVWETLVITKSGQPIKQLYPPKVDNGEEPIWMAIKVKGKDRIKSAYDLKVNLGGYCFNGTTKVRTQSPALAALEILTTSVNKNRINPSKIDINSFTAWDSWCSSAGYTFNTAYYKDETLKSVLDDASRAGLGRVIITDQGFRAVYDAGAANATPTQIFTPRNSWNFSATQSADKIPDAVKIMYLNEDTATQDSVIVYNTGYDENTAFDIADYSFRGITTHDHAASIASFLLNTANLRPTTYKFTTTIEALRSIVGDKVKLQHDSIAVGYGSGRVIETTTSAGNITSVRLDERIVLGGAASGDNSILFRANDGVVYISQVQEFNVETDTFTLSNPISDTVNLLDAIATVGKTSQETIDLVISDIEYSNDFSATITGFDAAPEVHNHTGKIPPYTPPAYLPPNIEQLNPPVPTIISAFASIEDSDVLPDGTPLAELKALFKSADNSVPIEKIEVQVWTDSSIDSQAQPVTYIIDPWEGLNVKVNFDDSIYLRARSISPYGKTSDWTDLQTITPTWTWPPSAVTNLQIENFDDKIKLSWDKHERPSVKEYEVRRGDSWSTATILGRTTDTFFIDYAQGIGNNSYLVAPIDSTTEEVGAVASVILTVINPAVTGLTVTIIQNRVKLSWNTTPGTWPIDRHEIVIDGDEVNKIKINGNNNAYWLNDLSLGTHTVIVRAVSIVGATHEQSITFDIIDRPIGTTDDSGVFVRNWETDAQINELQSNQSNSINISNLGRNGSKCLDITNNLSGYLSENINDWVVYQLPDKVQSGLLNKRVRFQSYIKSKDGITPPSGGNIILWDSNFNDDIMVSGAGEKSGSSYVIFEEVLYDASDPDSYILKPGDVLSVNADLKIDNVALSAGASARLYIYVRVKDSAAVRTWPIFNYVESINTSYENKTVSLVVPNDIALNNLVVDLVKVSAYRYPDTVNNGTVYFNNIKANIHGKSFSISTENSNILDDWINIGDITKIPSYALNIRYGVASSYNRDDGNGCLLDDLSIFPVPDKIDSNNIEQWISKAAIGDAYISSLIADKIKSGTISSEVIYIGDQSIQIDGINNWILIKDKQGTPRSRVVLGKTGPNNTDYGITIYDENGNVLLGTNRSFDSSLVDALSTQNAPLEAGADNTGNRIHGTGGLLPNWNLDIIDSEDKPAGIQPVESVADRNGIAATADGLKIQHPLDNYIAYGFPAIPIDDKQRYRVVITHRSGQSIATGLYLRFNELSTALDQGKTHVGWNTTAAEVQFRTSLKDLLANGPMPGPTWVTDEYIYTPTPGTKFASFSMYHWGNATSFEYEVDRVQIIPIAKTASDIDYSDGTNVDALKPRDPAATAGADWDADLANRPKQWRFVSEGSDAYSYNTGLPRGVYDETDNLVFRQSRSYGLVEFFDSDGSFIRGRSFDVYGNAIENYCTDSENVAAWAMNGGASSTVTRRDDVKRPDGYIGWAADATVYEVFFATGELGRVKCPIIGLTLGDVVAGIWLKTADGTSKSVTVAIRENDASVAYGAVTATVTGEWQLFTVTGTLTAAPTDLRLWVYHSDTNWPDTTLHVWGAFCKPGTAATADDYAYAPAGVQGRSAGHLAAQIRLVPRDRIIAIVTFDEPQANRTGHRLPDAIKAIGGSRAVFQNPDFKYRAAYLLVGKNGLGAGNGIEMYSGNVSNDKEAIIDTTIAFKRGMFSGTTGTPDVEGGSDNTTRAIESVVTINDQGAIQNASWDTGTKKIKIDFANPSINIAGDGFFIDPYNPKIIAEANNSQPRFLIAKDNKNYLLFETTTPKFELGQDVHFIGYSNYASDSSLFIEKFLLTRESVVYQIPPGGNIYQSAGLELVLDAGNYATYTEVYIAEPVRLNETILNERLDENSNAEFKTRLNINYLEYNGKVEVSTFGYGGTSEKINVIFRIEYSNVYMDIYINSSTYASEYLLTLPELSTPGNYVKGYFDIIFHIFLQNNIFYVTGSFVGEITAYPSVSTYFYSKGRQIQVTGYSYFNIDKLFKAALAVNGGDQLGSPNEIKLAHYKLCKDKDLVETF